MTIQSTIYGFCIKFHLIKNKILLLLLLYKRKVGKKAKALVTHPS